MDKWRYCSCSLMMQLYASNISEYLQMNIINSELYKAPNILRFLFFKC